MFKINHYFDGNVASIAFKTASLPATVGVMAIGEYKFGTSQKEVMSVISGAMSAKLPGDDKWKTYQAGDSFSIEAGASFEVKTKEETAYLCTYE